MYTMSSELQKDNTKYGRGCLFSLKTSTILCTVFESLEGREEKTTEQERRILFSLFMFRSLGKKKRWFFFSLVWKLERNEKKIKLILLFYPLLLYSREKKNWILKNCIWKRKQRWKFIDDIDIIQTIKKTRGIKRRENP